MNKNSTSKIQPENLDKIITTDSDTAIKEEIKQLTIARLQVIPKDIQISIGSEDYSKEELMQSVINEDEIGQQVMNTQLEFLRAIAAGKFYEEENEQIDPDHPA